MIAESVDEIPGFHGEPFKKTLGFCYVEWGPEMAQQQDTTDLYRELGERHAELYDEIPVPVHWTDDDPYNSYEEMRSRVFREGELWVYQGGSHPDGMTHEQNVKGRAVHDWFGHLQHDVGFSFEGEFLKWYNTKALYPKDTHQLLFTEIVCQRAAISYLEDGFADPQFEQHGFESPEAWINHCRDLFIND